MTVIYFGAWKVVSFRDGIWVLALVIGTHRFHTFNPWLYSKTAIALHTTSIQNQIFTAIKFSWHDDISIQIKSMKWAQQRIFKNYSGDFLCKVDAKFRTHECGNMLMNTLFSHY